MSRARLLIGLAVGLGLGALAYQWAAHDRPYGAAPPHRDAGVAAAAVAPDASPPPVADATVTIAVVDARTGAALPDVTVELRRPGEALATTAVSGGDGLAGLPITAGRWQLTARRGGAPLVLTEAADWTIDALAVPDPIVRALPAADVPPPPELPPPPTGHGTLVGEVTLAGAHPYDLIVTPFFLGDYGPGHPVVRDRVPVPIPLPARRFLGSAGRFRWDDLAPGSYAVWLVVPDRGAAIVRATVTADLAGNASAALPPAASVSGRAADDRGAELAAVVISAAIDGLTLATVQSDAHGTWVIPDLPAGAARLSASSPGCIGDRPTVTLTAGQRTVQALGLLCTAATSTP
ncbi:MAG: carboxypeptidase regulatory-like domain-containing protein [Myxococcales bacterium]|nr:carboxypeptidase regulatory-like domain-containing protein [Myxococcales bacterium]